MGLGIVPQRLAARGAVALLCALITTACGTASAPTPISTVSHRPQPSPNPTTAPTHTPAPPSEPTAAALPDDGPLSAGTYRYDRSEFTRVPFRFTVPDGWQARNGGWSIRKGDEDHGQRLRESSVVENIYANACTGMDAGGVLDVGPSADDLVIALMEQRVSNATGPFETTIGWVPRTASRPGEYHRLRQLQGCAAGEGLQIWHGQEGWYTVFDGQNSVYVVDVNGLRAVLPIVIKPEASAADIAELDAIIQSIEFET